MTAGLKDRFIDDAERGLKRHTIRGGKRWRAGMRIDLFKDVRRKGMKLIFSAPVTRVEDIKIYLKGPRHCAMRIVLNDLELSADEVRRLAQADGFADSYQMYRFWMLHHYPKKHANQWWSFDGQIIHWDYDKRSYEQPKRKRKPATAVGKQRRAVPPTRTRHQRKA